MDYKNLLIKYIGHVRLTAGTDYIDNIYFDESEPYNVLPQEGRSELIRLSALFRELG